MTWKSMMFAFSPCRKIEQQAGSFYLQMCLIKSRDPSGPVALITLIWEHHHQQYHWAHLFKDTCCPWGGIYRYTTHIQCTDNCKVFIKKHTIERSKEEGCVSEWNWIHSITFCVHPGWVVGTALPLPLELCGVTRLSTHPATLHRNLQSSSSVAVVSCVGWRMSSRSLVLCGSREHLKA